MLSITTSSRCLIFIMSSIAKALPHAFTVTVLPVPLTHPFVPGGLMGSGGLDTNRLTHSRGLWLGIVLYWKEPESAHKGSAMRKVKG